MDLKLISQLGKHSKYNVAVSSLITMPIVFPSIQREIIDDHVREIHEFQTQYYNKHGFFFFLNCIQFGRLNHTLYCVDGQHRFHAIKQLFTERILYDWNIDIEITECQTMEELHELFRLINLNKPVPEFLMEQVSVSNTTSVPSMPSAPKATVESIRQYLKQTYPNFIKSTSKPQRPNINLDLFLNELHKKYPFRSFESMDAFIEWFERENAAHKIYLESNNKMDSIQKCLAAIESTTKTRQGRKLYLGCYWLDSIKNKLNCTTRHKCWKQWYSKLDHSEKSPSGEALCPCCEETFVDAHNFEAGHIISFRNGGTDEISNLIPICSMCNKSMGVMNFDKYKELLV
jgi:5-methylcytosine-specific restriction endonuclease McrA